MACSRGTDGARGASRAPYRPHALVDFFRSPPQSLTRCPLTWRPVPDFPLQQRISELRPREVSGAVAVDRVRFARGSRALIDNMPGPLEANRARARGKALL